jgi:hypothetical protein
VDDWATVNLSACAQPQRLPGDVVSPSTISLFQASTIAEIRILWSASGLYAFQSRLQIEREFMHQQRHLIRLGRQVRPHLHGLTPPACEQWRQLTAKPAVQFYDQMFIERAVVEAARGDLVFHPLRGQRQVRRQFGVAQRS